ncbi:hypothetical protein [Streptomyces sp. NRRL F-3273]|uniref:hypothetical protein n=1 Tax=Streptomyces sp. NRRL F-3273 TaxID=1463848 RepID=UPI000AF2A445|nr:hypothetical protein [Streptomyces sp. NRRL F-3273]
MDLTPYVDNLRRELAAAADASGDEARALAERLSVPLESAARLTLLNVLSAAMGDVTRELAPGSVDVRLRGLDPEFVVTPPPAPEPVAEVRELAAAPVVAAPPAGDADDGTMVRINLRLPAHLKGRAEGAGPRPEYVQYEGLEPARREHAPDAARPPYGRRRDWSDRP